MGRIIGFSIFSFFVYIPILALWIYCFILFIRLARRGIRVLDIYLEKNGGQDNNMFNS